MAETMEAQRALQMVAELPRYSETLTSRAAGLTMMAWGTVVAGTFMTYAALHGIHSDSPWMALLGFSWVPWAGIGLALTFAIRRSHAITLGGPDTVKAALLRTLAWVGAFLVLLYGIVAAYQAPFAAGWNMAGLIVLAFALLTALLVAVSRRSPVFRRSNAAVAGLLVLAGIGLAASSLEMGLVLMLGAPLIGGLWFLSGLVTFLQG